MSKVLVITKPYMGVERPEQSQIDHEETLSLVRQCLSKNTYVVKDTLTCDVSSQEFDFVVTVGGDGTLLYVSHFIDQRVPVLAINSAPKYSEGYFCGANGQQDVDQLKAYLNNWHKLPLTLVTRLEVEVNGKVLTRRGLNDALFCHSNPAMTSRYELKAPGDLKAEAQKSSGVWFSTAVGSTAAIRSAGGFTSPHDSPNLQYLVREPFQPAGKRLQRVHGFFEPNETIEIVSSIEDGHVYVDGTHINQRVGIKGTVFIRRSPESLNLLNFRQKNHG